MPGFNALNRMIAWELARVFALTLVGVNGIFLIGGVIQQASQLGLGPGRLIQVIPLLVPSFLPYTIPATVLFASCVAYGRLSNDNEVVAIKAAGIDLYSVLWPAIFLGLFGTAVVAAVSYALIPRTQVQLQEEIARDPEEFLYNQLKRDGTFRSPNSAYDLYVRDVQNRRLVDVIIKRKAGVEALPDIKAVRYRYDYVMRAPEAELRIDLARRQLTVDARNVVAADLKSRTDTNGTPQIVIDLPEMLNAEEIRARPIAMDWDRLLPAAAGQRAKAAEIAAQRAEADRAAAAETDPANLQKFRVQDAIFQQQIKDAGRNARNAEYEFHARPALAVSCLAFALIGCPVGVWFNRSDYLSTFVVCWIPTVTVYFPLFFAGGGLAKDGKIPMPLGVWLADAVVLGLAALLVTRLLKR